MYPLVLQAHGQLRWIVLLALAVRALRGLQAWSMGKPHTRVDRVMSLAMIIVLDTQLLLGLLLYFVLSPVAAAARANIGAAMGDATLRFVLVEHTFAMVVALIVAHVGHRVAKTAATDAARHRAGMLGATVALVLVCAGIPWAFRRP